MKLTVKQDSKCTIDFVPADEEALPVHSTSGTVELSIMKKGGTPGAHKLTCNSVDRNLGENNAHQNLCYHCRARNGDPG